MNPHKANQAFWDSSTNWWKEAEDKRGIWRKAHKDPSLVFSTQELAYIKNISGKKVCVLGSGDNEVAFGFAGLGGIVTSVDISQKRIEVAEERAGILGLELTFVQADVTDLSVLSGNTFDLVYTGGHMSVWISDIKKYYSEATRILKMDSLFIVNDYHPIRRIWIGSDGAEPNNEYFNPGPYEYNTENGFMTYEYHWTISDHINAVIAAGCKIITVDELESKIEDEWWVEADLDKLPSFLLIIGKKVEHNPAQP